MEKQKGIYAIKNKVNGKMYIGQSTNIAQRQRSHRYQLNSNSHPNIHLQNAFNKDGLENFEFIILEFCETKSLDERERFWINFYNSTSAEFGYNIESGGHFQKELSEATKIKISKKAKLRGIPKETQEKAWAVTKEKLKNPENHPMYGKKMSEESKEKMAKAKIGVKRGPHTEETIKKIKESNTGKKRKPHTEEWKEKQRKKMTGRIFDEDHRKNISETRKGMKFSEEHKNNLSLNHHSRIPITDEMKQDLLNGMTEKAFAEKYDCKGPIIRIKKAIKNGTLEALK